MDLEDIQIQALAARLDGQGYSAELEAGNVSVYPGRCVGTTMVTATDDKGEENFALLVSLMCNLCPEVHYYLFPIPPVAAPYVLRDYPGIGPATDPYLPEEAQ